jgi:uncharacterized protein YneF (UPF0154 family)
MLFIITVTSLIIAFVGEEFLDRKQIHPERLFSALNNIVPTAFLAYITGFDHSFLAPFLFRYLGLCTVALILIATLPIITGWIEGVIYGIKCVRREQKDDPKLSMTYAAVTYRAKYGRNSNGSDGIYDIAPRHLMYALFSNVSGAACTISLFWFANSIPEFVTFVNENEWTNYFDILLTVSFFIAFMFTKTQQSEHRTEENPHNFMLNRAHQLLNVFHLIVTFFYCMLLVMTMIAFGVFQMVHGHTLPALPATSLLPLIAVIAFLLYAAGSDIAYEYNQSNFGNFMMGVLMAVAVANIWYWVLFSYSAAKIGLAVLSAAVLVIYIFTLRYRKRKNPNVPVLHNMLTYSSVIMGVTVIALSTTIGLTL